MNEVIQSWTFKQETIASRFRYSQHVLFIHDTIVICKGTGKQGQMRSPVLQGC